MNTVYTAIFNNFDHLRSPSNISRKWTYICICNPWMMVPAPWELSIRDMVGTPRKSSRYYKILSHETFPKADITVWHGGNVQLRCDLDDLVSILGNADIAVLRHSERTSVYHEAKACIDQKKDCPTRIRTQMARYRDEGFPGKPLSAAFLIVRRNNDTVAKLNELWWSEVGQGSIRDQLSFDYCCWRLGITPVVIPGDIFKGPHFKRYPLHQGG